MISNKKKKKLIIGAVLLVIVLVACIMCYTVPLGLAAKLKIDIDLAGQPLSPSSDEYIINNEMAIADNNMPTSLAEASRAYERMQKTAVTSDEGLFNNVTPTAHASSDDVLVSFNVLDKSEINFTIIVIFYFSDWSGGSRGVFWSSNDSKGSKLICSGKSKVYKMECNWKVTHNGVTTEGQYTFESKA